ncbi:MAG: diaminopimelate epimerase [Lentisphaerae bacterium]|nr:diaminopimelate epimerase [Lentisphaerota bacterium]
MNIPFWKMHGASNDFILVDDRAKTFPTEDNTWIAKISARRTGVGCEGIILIQPSEKASFRMRFFNPDGNEVEMCGNGARCVAKLAAEINAAPEHMSIETIAGILKAEIVDEDVLLHMTRPTDLKTDLSIDVNGRTIVCSFVNTGVPHVVVLTENLASVAVDTLGRAIRYHDAFAPAGTNANFVSVTGTETISVRTYERGVEAETLACGTGIVASAVILGILGKVKPPVRVTAASGDILIVGFDVNSSNIGNVTLLGPAVHVFEGILKYKN